MPTHLSLPYATPGILRACLSHPSSAFRCSDSIREQTYLDTVPPLGGGAGSVACAYCQWCACSRWGCGWAARNVGTCVRALISSACQDPCIPPLEEPENQGCFSVLVCLSCCNKIPESRDLINNTNFVPSVLEARSPRSGRQGSQVLLKALFQVGDCWLLTSPCVLTGWKGSKELCGVSFIGTWIPFMRAPPTWSNHLPRGWGSPPNTIDWALGFWHMNVVGVEEGRETEAFRP